MAKMDEQLVRQVVEQVLTMLQQQANTPTAASKHIAPAAFQPTMGVCTGDYSKFPELAGRLYGKQSAHASGPSPVHHDAADAAAAPVLTGIVTAQQLQEALAASPDGVVMLAADARPTPLANDFIRQSPEKVRRLSRTVAAQGASLPVTDAIQLPWLLWADGHCPHVQKMTTQLASRFRPSAAPRNEAGLLQVIRDLQQQVASNHLAGGLLFVRSSAQAVCFANRCRALRAIVGTCDQTVEQGIRDLGANVLVIEYPYVSGELMQAMTQRMLDHPPRLSSHVRRQLNELANC